MKNGDTLYYNGTGLDLEYDTPYVILWILFDNYVLLGDSGKKYPLSQLITKREWNLKKLLNEY